MRSCFFAIIVALSPTLAAAAEVTVDTTAALVAAVNDGAEGDTIHIAAGTYELSAPLEPKSKMTLAGAGIDKTILTHTKDWKPSPASLPDPEVKLQGLDSRAYLIRLPEKSTGITITNLTLHGPQVHGAIFAAHNTGMHLHHLRIKEVMWSGVRTLFMKGAKIHDCEFIDAGGRWERGGVPGVKGGITAGGIFSAWVSDSEIYNNRFTRERKEKQHEFYGIKMRKGENTRIHHNTIEVNFSIEMAHEHDQDVEIDHNVCFGTVSIPKHSGGNVPPSGKSFHIHHNWFRDSYSIEFVRNGVEIDHNLFDFSLEKDHGNLISGFGQAPAKGPAKFHNNLVSNPGRGVIWINEPYSNLEVRNNHVIARTTVTPRKDGLFGFNRQCDFGTFTFRDNIFECQGEARPLFRNKESYAATVENNTLTNIADAEQLKNPKGTATPGLESPLKFECGAYGEFTVDGWEGKPTAGK